MEISCTSCGASWDTSYLARKSSKSFEHSPYVQKDGVLLRCPHCSTKETEFSSKGPKTMTVYAIFLNATKIHWMEGHPMLFNEQILALRFIADNEKLWEGVDNLQVISIKVWD